MKKPIPFSVIGAFVVSALVILVSGILFFGSGNIFTKYQSYVLFFDQSVNGLKAGSPVKFRGVEVGSVDRITLGGPNEADPQIAVVVKLFESSLGREFQGEHDFSKTDVVRDLVSRGLRAQLRSQSILSGDLYVSLDLFPDDVARYVLQDHSSWIEVPTVRSGLMEDFTANSSDLNDTLTGALNEFKRVLSQVDEKLNPLTDESVLTMQEMRKMMKTVADLLDPASPLGYQAPKTLTEVERAARAVRHLAESLERNPSSLLFGKSRVEVVEVQ